MNTVINPRIVSLSGGSPVENQNSNRMPLYPQLNGWRFVFVFLVLIHHWGPQGFFEQYRAGWLGVDLFFVLSGFLIGEILLLEKGKTKNRMKSIGNFVMRRTLRIFPLYYLTILLYSALVTTGGIFIWNITYTNNILQAIDLEQVSEEFWHLWSLCVEEQFYLFFPFFIFFVPRQKIFYVLIIGIGGSIAGRFVGASVLQNTATYTLMPLCLDSLFSGVLLAYLKIFHTERLRLFFQKKWVVLIGVIAATTALMGLCYSQNELAIYPGFRFFASALGFLVIGYAVMIRYAGVLKAFLENRFISLMGKISYGIYLLHPFIEKLYYQYADQNVVRNFLIGLEQPIVSNRYVIDFIFLFLATISISYLSFHLIEKRFLKLKLLFS